MSEANTHKKKVKRLHDVEATHVSLVDHPANRTPFKFIKRADGAKPEAEMNHSLMKMFASRNAAAVTSVVAKSKTVAEALAKALMPTAKEFTVTEQGGLVEVRNAATPASGEEQVIHAGEARGIAYTVANLDKALSLYDMDTTNFDEVVQKEGFVPGLMTGLDALHSTIANIAMSEDVADAAAFKKQVGDAIGSFQKYMDELITSLPTSAFKFEKALIAVRSPNFDAAAGVPGSFDPATYDAIFGDAKEEEQPAAEAAPAAEEAPKAEEASAEGAPAQEAEEAGAAAEEASQAASEEAAPANLEELPKTGEEAVDLEKVVAEAMAALTKSLAPQFKAITDSVTALSEKVDANDGKVTDLAKSIGSTVASTPDTDGGDSTVVELRKGSVTGEPPLLDTAYGGNRG